LIVVELGTQDKWATEYRLNLIRVYTKWLEPLD
jgi:hypothetical protein